MKVISYMVMLKRTLLILVGAVVVVGVAIQFVPVNRANPPVTATINWNSPVTKALWDKACADCHSNETVWPAYSYVAPVSWLLARNVAEGRREINLSQPLRGQPSRVAGEMAEKITKGEMPPRDYLILHPAAALNAADRQTLIDGLRTTLGGGR